ncbi:MAG: DUF3311 domain-containing protein [Thaumarchaeota archaeon]|nr:DUF3311 domain-containing protein [Nitrososphaerota archaeon]
MKSKDAVAAVLIIIPFIVYFAIPTYNMVNPMWGGVPFFWWYQTVWLALSAVLFFFAAVLMGRKS